MLLEIIENCEIYKKKKVVIEDYSSNLTSIVQKTIKQKIEELRSNLNIFFKELQDIVDVMENHLLCYELERISKLLLLKNDKIIILSSINSLLDRFTNFERNIFYEIQNIKDPQKLYTLLYYILGDCFSFKVDYDLVIENYKLLIEDKELTNLMNQIKLILLDQDRAYDFRKILLLYSQILFNLDKQETSLLTDFKEIELLVISELDALLKPFTIETNYIYFLKIIENIEIFLKKNIIISFCEGNGIEIKNINNDPTFISNVLNEVQLYFEQKKNKLNIKFEKYNLKEYNIPFNLFD
jgi:hypothetical protein